MDWRDLVPFIAGIICVLAMAFYANSIMPPGPGSTETTGITEPSPSEQAKIPVQILWTPPTTPVPTPTLPVIEPYRIFYTDTPLDYPRFRLPENLRVYGSSDIPDRYKKNVVFAFLEESRGGLTRVFKIPYPTWVMNVTVIANRTPEYALFRMALCDAKTGDVYEGAELQFPGTIYKAEEVSGRDMYLIISTSAIDRYRINFETSAENIRAYHT